MEDKKKAKAADEEQNATLAVGEMSTEAEAEFASGKEDGENE